MRITRRQMLQGTAAMAAMTAATPLYAAADIDLEGFVIRCYDPAGNPLPASALAGLFLFEAAGDRNPLPHSLRSLLDGQVRTAIPDRWPFGFSYQMEVPGFGNVRMYADDDGQGYRRRQAVVLNRELAASRLSAVQKLSGNANPGQRIAQAEALLKRGDEARADPKRAVPLWMQSLRESMWAGEELVLSRARAAIDRRGPRKGFLFGCNFFGYPELGEDYAEKFAGLLNFATLPFYWKYFEPEEGKPGFERVDRMLARLEQSRITAKGHPLCWFHEAGCPKWMEGKTFEQWRDRYRQRITEIVSRYKGRIKVYDVINEAHDWGNDPQFSQEQLLEMTRMSADATREADPDAIRVVNNCCIFGEYVADQTTYKGKQPRALRTPLQYLHAVLNADVDFNAIGLQVYYPGHDMFEIARMLDRYAALGKPLHITELGVASRDDRDPAAMNRDPGKAYWHAPWSETIQADWIEQFYTICYAHAAVQAITWWDFSDATGHFWPHCGFIRPDKQPKESYHGLQALRRKWGV